jgi:hypothetical protein
LVGRRLRRRPRRPRRRRWRRRRRHVQQRLPRRLQRRRYRWRRAAAAEATAVAGSSGCGGGSKGGGGVGGGVVVGGGGGGCGGRERGKQHYPDPPGLPIRKMCGKVHRYLSDTIGPIAATYTPLAGCSVGKLSIYLSSRGRRLQRTRAGIGEPASFFSPIGTRLFRWAGLHRRTLEKVRTSALGTPSSTTSLYTHFCFSFLDALRRQVFLFLKDADKLHW